MKKLFVSILALAAFAACQSDFSEDVDVATPQLGGGYNKGAYTLYAEVGVENATTKATYDDNLKATWEENDQIALLQEHANYGSTFSGVGVLNIKEGWGTNSASFNGNISVDSNAPRVYHVAYPASAVSFSTTSELSVEGVSYQNHQPGMHKLSATGYGKYTYNSTLNITIPTTQNGKWEPYMYASTSEAVNSEAIGAKVLTTLNGAIAIRAFEPDGVTPKKLKSITITSSNANIAGAFSGTAQSVGNTITITGEKSAAWVSWEEDSAKAEALGYLTTALQGYEATSTSVTKAMSLSFVGSGKSITISGLENIPADSDGYYTYYINVAPATFAAGTLTIEATDMNNATTKKTLKDEVTVAASKRIGAKVVWESAVLNCDDTTIETWYDNYGKGSAFELAGSTIYVDNVSVEGNLLAENVKALGVEINGVFHEASAQSGVLDNDLAFEISGLTSGYYEVQPCAKVMLNGEEKTLYGPKVTKTVTTIPTVSDYYVTSSYSHNGGIQKTNDIAGDLLKVKANISDPFIANNGLVNGTKYEVYKGGTKLGEKALGSEWTTNVGYNALGQYDCYVKITLANGYIIESQQYTTHVTGIPCEADWTSSDCDWTLSDCSDKGRYLEIARGKTGGVLSHAFYAPASTSIAIDPYVACSGFGTSSRKLYVTLVEKSATSVNAAGSTQTPTYYAGVAYPDDAPYIQWTESSLNLTNGQRLSVAVNGGKAGINYQGQIYKVKVWYKLQ